MKNLKTTIYKIVAKGKHGKVVFLYFDYFILSLISLNIIAIVLESIPEISKVLKTEFQIFELFSIIVFSLEYLFRIYVSSITHPSKNMLSSSLKFIFSIYGILDLLAILPFYLPFITKIDLRFVRILRLLRIFRLYKLSRYTKSINVLIEVIKEKKSELLMTIFTTFLLIVFASILVFFVENEKQPEKFSSILDAFWWAIATLTTVGYGDIFPVTATGKIISSIVAFIGVGLVALPTGILSSGFLEKVQKNKKKCVTKCPHCGKEIEDKESI